MLTLDSKRTTLIWWQPAAPQRAWLAGPDGYPRVLDYSIFKSLLVPYSKNFTTRSSSRVVTIFSFLSNHSENGNVKLLRLACNFFPNKMLQLQQCSHCILLSFQLEIKNNIHGIKQSSFCLQNTPTPGIWGG